MTKHLLFIWLLLLSLSCKEKNKYNFIAENNKKQPIKKAPELFSPISEEERIDKSEKIDYHYNRLINTNDYSGSFLIAKNGQILFEDYQGYSDYLKKEKITANTSLHIASISKVFTATAILKLSDNDKLDINNSVCNYLTNFPYCEITIKDLLSHRSGLVNYAYVYEKIKPNSLLTNQDLLELLNLPEIKLEFPPNTKFSYCNTNYAILALIIEEITKLKFPKAMENIIFNPLGMKNSFVFDFEKHKDMVSKSYKSNWDEFTFNDLDKIYGDKNIYSTPRDLFLFDKALYSETFLSSKSKTMAYKGYSYEKKGIKNYGLGIRLNEWEDGNTIFYHNGWWHGNTSSYISLKKDTVTLINLSNKYTKKTYQTIHFSSLFNKYPYTLE